MHRIAWRRLALWALYDFANSIAVITFFLYFAQWLVVDRGVSDFWFNAIFVGSTALLLALAPTLGARSDRRGRRMPYLRATTLAVIALYGGAASIAAFAPEQTLVAALLFMAGNGIYQLSFVFYNPLLTELGPERRWGTISGIGQAANWTGQVVGLIATLPLATGALYWGGAAGRAQPLLPAVILFALLSLPMLLFFREQPRERTVKSAPDWRSLMGLLALPSVGVFMLAYFLFNDAFLTLTNNLPIYLERVFGVSDQTKSFAMLGALLGSALGGFVGGWVADRAGARRTLVWILCIWIAIIPGLAFAPNFAIFAVLMGMAGLFFGATWAVTRALFAQFLPSNKMVQGFSLYVLAERTASFAGPISWGAAVVLLPAAHHANYRGAMLLMTAFVILGLIVAVRLPRPSAATART